MIRSTCALLGFLACSVLANAADEDPIAEELVTAKKAHVIAMAKANEAMTQAFDTVEKSIRTDVSLKADQQIELLRQLRKEREAFAAESILPDNARLKAAAAEHKRAMTAADKIMEQAFEKAIKNYTKLGDDTTAEALLVEKKHLLAGLSLASVFSVGAVWEGKHVYGGMEYPAKLTITSQDRETFTGKLSWVWNKDPEAVTKVEGRITKDGIVFRITKVEKGMGIFCPVDYRGKIGADGSVSGDWIYKVDKGDQKGSFRYTRVVKIKP